MHDIRVKCGSFTQKMRDFRVEGGMFREKTCDFPLKHRIFEKKKNARFLDEMGLFCAENV